MTRVYIYVNPEYMTRTDVERFEGSSSKRRRLLHEEELILDVTELLSSALQDKQMTKSELAVG